MKIYDDSFNYEFKDQRIGIMDYIFLLVFELKA